MRRPANGRVCSNSAPVSASSRQLSLTQSKRDTGGTVSPPRSAAQVERQRLPLAQRQYQSGTCFGASGRGSRWFHAASRHAQAGIAFGSFFGRADGSTTTGFDGRLSFPAASIRDDAVDARPVQVEAADALVVHAARQLRRPARSSASRGSRRPGRCGRSRRRHEIASEPWTKRRRHVGGRRRRDAVGHEREPARDLRLDHEPAVVRARVARFARRARSRRRRAAARASRPCRSSRRPARAARCAARTAASAAPRTPARASAS